jgi:hypothetical protein
MSAFAAVFFSPPHRSFPLVIRRLKLRFEATKKANVFAVELCIIIAISYPI